MVSTFYHYSIVRISALIILIGGGLSTWHFSQCHYATWVSSSPLNIATHGNLWSSMVNDFSLNQEKAKKNADVQIQINYYLSHKPHLYQMIKNAAPYLFYIYQQTQKHHMPAELTLLPFIESEYSPFAYSKRGAVGLWQMMPGTATGFGVKIDSWYDGRLDLLQSTQAALDYLDYLYRYLDHHWLLAIAAYNSGEGTVREAIHKNTKRHQPVDFWSLPLPDETHHYILKLLALSIIISDPEHYHLHLPIVNNAPYLSSIQLNRPLDLNKIASLVHLPTDYLYRLNAGLKHKMVIPNEHMPLLLPLKYAKLLKEKLLSLSHYQALLQMHYRVKPRDTLARIAQRYYTKVATLKKLNHLSSTHLYKGQTLLIPYTIAQLTRKHTFTDSNIRDGHHNRGPYLIHHRIKQNDSLPKIARHYHVTTAQLAFWNKLKYPYKMKAGQTLLLWKPVKNYRVKPGDTLLDIALKFKCSLSALKKHNNIRENEELIWAGETLKIR